MSSLSVRKPRPTNEREHFLQLKQSLCHCRSSKEMYLVPPSPVWKPKAFCYKKRIVHQSSSGAVSDHTRIKGETYSSEKIYLLPCLFCYPYSVQSMTFKVWHYVIQQKRRATAPEQKSDSFFLSVLWCLQSIVFCKNVFRSLKKVFTGCVMTWAPALREECLKKRSRLAKLQKALKSVRLWRLSWGVLKLYRGKKETNVS